MIGPIFVGTPSPAPGGEIPEGLEERLGAVELAAASLDDQDLVYPAVSVGVYPYTEPTGVNAGAEFRIGDGENFTGFLVLQAFESLEDFITRVNGALEGASLPIEATEEAGYFALSRTDTGETIVVEDGETVGASAFLFLMPPTVPYTLEFDLKGRFKNTQARIETESRRITDLSAEVPSFLFDGNGIIVGPNGDFQYISDAINWLRNRPRRSGARVVLLVEAGYYDEQIFLSQDDFSWLEIRGAEEPVHIPNGALGVAGAIRNYSVTIPLAEAAVYQVGDFVLVWLDGVLPGIVPTDPAIGSLGGFWRITAKGASSITVQNTASLNGWAASAVNPLNVRVCKISTLIRHPERAYQSQDGTRGPTLRSIGFVQAGAPNGSSWLVNAADSEINFFCEPDATPGARPYVGIWGADHGLVMRRSRSRGIPVASACQLAGLILVSKSTAHWRGMISNGNGLTSGSGLYVEGHISISDASDFCSLACGNRHYGVDAELDASVILGTMALLGNGLADLYVYNRAYARLSSAPYGQVNSVSPSFGAVGSNNYAFAQRI